MVVFPIIAATISGAFSVLLLRRFARRKRMTHLGWGIALAMYATASLIVAAGVSQGWDATLFKGFWLFGAMLNVPFLALGSVALIGNRILTALATLAVAALALYGIGIVASADANPDAFVQQEGARGDCPVFDPALPRAERLDIPRGKCVWPKGSSVGKLGSGYSIPAYAIVVLIAVVTSRPRRGVQPPKHRVLGNQLIVAGVTIVAAGGTAIGRFGRGAPFSIALALGAIVMFAGFGFASRAPAPPPP